MSQKSEDRKPGVVETMEMEHINNDKKVPYPKGVFFIMGTELSERFSYYGMRAVLTIYMRNQLSFNENEATSYYHIFLMLCYGLPMFWGVVADSWLGKFRTILYVSILFAIGNVVLTLSSISSLQLPTKEFFFLGLILMAIGTAGMKPCVAPLGAEQFQLPQQELHLKQFFSFFFFAVTIGNMASTVITPIFRRDVSCFGSDSCYPLAFGVPATIMLLAIVILLAGRPLFKVTKPSGNMLVKVSKCIAHALSNRRKKSPEVAHWLDCASDSYDQQLIADIKGLLRVLVYYLPIPMFFALYEQLGSRWTLQATRMKGNLGKFTIKPDQMQVSNALLMFIFLPVFQYIVYPLMAKCGLFKRPLQKMVVGGILAALSFGVAGIVETRIEPDITDQPAHDLTVVNFVNGIPCPVNVWINPNSSFVQNYTVDSDNYFTLPPSNFKNGVPIHIKTAEGCRMLNANSSTEWEGNIKTIPKAFQTVSISLALDGNLAVTTFPFSDDFAKSKDGNARLRFVVIQETDNSFKQTAQNQLKINLSPSDGGGKEQTFTLNAQQTVFSSATEEIAEDEYDVNLLRNDTKIRLDETLNLRNGGSYVLVIFMNAKLEIAPKSQLITITPANNIHILWLLPQYVLMAWGEILFIVSGMEFSFTEAPESMKSVLQALWHLMNACGNLIVIIASQNHGHGSQAVEFFIFAGCMFVDSIVFAFMAMRYKYVSTTDGTVVVH